MQNEVRITAAGNVETPAYLALLEKGFVVRKEDFPDEDYELWYATMDDCEFSARGPIELLGVVCVYEVRGKEWKASDAETDLFTRDYCS